MKRWDVQEIPLTDRGNYAALIAEEWQSFSSNEQTLLLTAETGSDDPCNALLARLSQDRFEIVSLFVTESNRNQGIATSLLQAAEQLALANGYRTLDLCYLAIDSDQKRLLQFFIHRGFTFPGERACYYSLPVDELKQSKLAALPMINEQAASHIFPVNQIPDADARVSYSYIESKLPSGMHADHAPGQLLNEYSICYVSQKNVLAYVIFCERSGNLHLHCAFTDSPSSGKTLIALLRTAYDKLLKEPDRFSGFSVTTVNSFSEKLVHSLLEGTTPVAKHVFYTQKPIIPMTPMLPSWGAILARCNALSDVLVKNGDTVAVCTDPGMLPYLLWETSDNRQIELLYHVEDNTYTTFTLTAQYPVDISPDQAELFKETMAKDPGPAMLLPYETGDAVALVAIHTEGAIFDPETTTEFLTAFTEQVNRMQEELH